jgi:hypothetical protein
MLGYLHRLKGRMDATGFVPSDPLYRLVGEAFDAVHWLSVALHYMATDADKRTRRDRRPSG